MVQKKDIRDNVLKKRNFIDESDRRMFSEKIMEKVGRLEGFREADKILCYMNFGSEVITEDFLECLYQSDKEVYLPRVCRINKTMEFYRVDGRHQLVEGYMGILEPDIREDMKMFSDGKSGFMIMPGVGFDHHRNRIGYGGGFYDKYLSIHQDICKVMVAFDIQEVELFQGEDHDLKPDMIITESRVIKE